MSTAKKREKRNPEIDSFGSSLASNVNRAVFCQTVAGNICSTPLFIEHLSDNRRDLFL